MNMNTKIATSTLASLLVVASSACNEAKTHDQATSDIFNSPMATDQPSEAARDDAKSELRQDQLNADIRAREERNNVMGDRNMRDDSDLASEVRSKLEANIPGGILTIEAKDAVVTVSGTVPAQDQLGKIDKLAMEIKGVKSVNVKASVKSITN
jgi:osmotically-inducible protein OsmY